MLPGRWRFLLLTLIAYSLPWVVGPGAALTLNAYDLAEWTSLHPAVRTAPLPFLVTFGLRLLPLLIYVAFAMDSSSRQWERGLLAAIIATALLPPLNFFAGGFGDPNHRQQLALAALVLLSGGLSLATRSHSWQAKLQSIALVICTLLSAWALIASFDLMRGFTNRVQPAAGGFLLIVIVTVFAAKNIRGNFSQVTPWKRAIFGNS